MAVPGHCTRPLHPFATGMRKPVCLSAHLSKSLPRWYLYKHHWNRILSTAAKHGPSILTRMHNGNECIMIVSVVEVRQS
jgi:hypothetical protein